ncbi:MAG: hypothetical protein ACT4PT_05290 [Methanobacteriota archaeon]
MEIASLVAGGESYLKNAEEALARPILNEDQLYVWENQVEVLDTFLADTEEVADGNAQVAELRAKIRAAKKELEKKAMEFVVKQEGGELPEEAPEEDVVAEFLEYGKEFAKDADKALKAPVKGVQELEKWETPLMMINSFLADTEPYAKHAALQKLRGELRGKKRDLAGRIDAVIKDWRAADLAGGAADDEDADD